MYAGARSGKGQGHARTKDQASIPCKRCEVRFASKIWVPQNRTCACECAHSSACNLPITAQFVYRCEGKARAPYRKLWKMHRKWCRANSNRRERERENWRNAMPSLAGRKWRGEAAQSSACCCGINWDRLILTSMGRPIRWCTQTHTAGLLHTTLRFGVRPGHRLPQG